MAQSLIQSRIRILLPLLALLSLGEGLAQFETGAVLGTVEDEGGGIIPGVTVTLTNVDTGITATQVSNDRGSFEFFNVRIGTYRVSAELIGFSTAVAERVNVTVNSRQRVNLVMKIGEITDTVEVFGAAPLIEADSSDRGQVIQQRQIIGLPLNGRNYSDLSLLSPGVRASEKAESREGSFNVHGLRSTMNNFMLDGVDNNAGGTSNQGFSNQVVQVSPDAVAEFKVQTNNFSAEFGRAGGAVVNAAIRSGTNDYRGTVWAFHRNDDLNARDFFTNKSGSAKPDLIRNQFGATFGGPIVRDKTFFFADYEGFREKRSSPAFSTIPTLEQRQGILGVPIRDPISGQLFEDGVIPQSEISPFAQKVFAGLPEPNLPGARNNFITNSAVFDNTDKFNVKIDHQVNERLSVFGRISNRKSNIFNTPAIPGPSGGGGNGFVRVLNQQLALGGTFTVSPTSLLEVRLGVSRTNAGKEPVNAGSAPAGELFGIPGLPTDQSVTGGLPNQSVSGFTAFGQQATNPQYQNPKSWNPRVNYSWIAGDHSLKVGYEFQRIRHDRTDEAYLASADDFPSLVLINRPGAHGTLIAGSWVLTAAHVAHPLKPGHGRRAGDFSPERTTPSGVEDSPDQRGR